MQAAPSPQTQVWLVWSQRLLALRGALASKHWSSVRQPTWQVWFAAQYSFASQSSGPVHSTQTPLGESPKQIKASPEHATGAPSLSLQTQVLATQALTFSSVQSPAVTHSTHWLVPVSQTEVSPVQALSSAAVHWTQMLRVGLPGVVSQAGVSGVSAQWSAVVHATQVLLVGVLGVVLQTGVAIVAVQSLLSSHATHVAVALPLSPRQMGLGLAHLPLVPPQTQT